MYTQVGSLSHGMEIQLLVTKNKHTCEPKLECDMRLGKKMFGCPSPLFRRQGRSVGRNFVLHVEWRLKQQNECKYEHICITWSNRTVLFVFGITITPYISWFFVKTTLYFICLWFGSGRKFGSVGGGQPNQKPKFGLSVLLYCCCKSFWDPYEHCARHYGSCLIHCL